MRNKLIAICILTFVIFLSACSQKSESKTFILEDNGNLTELQYTYENDKVSSQKTYNELNYDFVGFSNKEEAKENLGPTAKKYEDLDGVKYKLKFGNDKLVENIEVDYETLDFDKAEDIPGFEFNGDTSKGVSMKETEKLLKDNGFEEK